METKKKKKHLKERKTKKEKHHIKVHSQKFKVRLVPFLSKQ